mmetsp:Transcript_82261/g.233241  ORF Transcript_82261/g.233241 Transcript_82261/m.233241 type:complete len:452 (-) Transcript_82261:1008-2363(-)
MAATLRGRRGLGYRSGPDPSPAPRAGRRLERTGRSWLLAPRSGTARQGGAGPTRPDPRGHGRTGGELRTRLGRCRRHGACRGPYHARRQRPRRRRGGLLLVLRAPCRTPLELLLLHHLLLLPLLLLQGPLLAVVLVDALELRPGVVLALGVRDLLEEPDGLLRRGAGLRYLLPGHVQLGHQDQRGGFAAHVRHLLEQLHGLLGCLQGLRELPLHHLHLGEAVGRGPGVQGVAELLCRREGVLRHFRRLLHSVLELLLGPRAGILLLHHLEGLCLRHHGHRADLPLPVAQLLLHRECLRGRLEGLLELLVPHVDVRDHAQRVHLALQVAGVAGQVLRLFRRGHRLPQVLALEVGPAELHQRLDLLGHELLVLEELARLRRAPERPLVLLLLHVHLGADLQGDALLLQVLHLLEVLESVLHRPQRLVVVAGFPVQPADGAEHPALADVVLRLL